MQVQLGGVLGAGAVGWGSRSRCYVQEQGFRCLNLSVKILIIFSLRRAFTGSMGHRTYGSALKSHFVNS